MKLGAFSISLNGKDIKASKTFYENLGFIIFGGGIKTSDPTSFTLIDPVGNIILIDQHR